MYSLNYKISKFKTLRGSDAVKRINMLRFLKGSLDYIDSFDDAICSSCFYVYKKDGIIYSDILDEVISDEIKCEYENAINSLNFRKNIWLFKKMLYNIFKAKNKNF